MCPSSSLTQKTPGTHVANTITFTIYQQPPKSLSCGGVWFSRDINPNHICPWPRTVSESLRSEKAKRHGLCWVTHSGMKAEGRSSGFMANDLRQSGSGSERDGGNGDGSNDLHNEPQGREWPAAEWLVPRAGSLGILTKREDSRAGWSEPTIETQHWAKLSSRPEV